MRRLDFEKVQTANRERMRDINEAIVLNLIRDQQPISRVEISRKTGLQMSTVTLITKRLIDKELINEQGVAPSSGGRRPRLLELRAEKVCVFGLDIGVTEATLAVANFNGAILHRETFPSSRDSNLFWDQLLKRIEYLIASQRNEVEFEGLGISATGIVDTANGRILFSPNLDWRNVDVHTICEKRIRLPIYVDNDARLSALAETWHGNGKCGQAMNLVFVTVNEGIGSGIILNGQLYRGSSGGAGEFGHLSLDQRGPVCNCGNRGCWELYASDRATIQRFLRLSQKYISPGNKIPFGLTINDVLDLAMSGDKAALQSVKTTAKYLGSGIANIVNSLNPDLVVIGGEITQVWETIAPIIYKSLESKVFRQDLTCLRIVPSALEEKPSLVGAVLQALSGKLSVAKVA